MAASGKAIGAALRRHGAAEKHPQSVTSAQQAGLASRLPGQSASLPAQAHSLPGQAAGLPGQASGLPGSLPPPVIAVERSQAGLVVHISPGPGDGRDAAQTFPDTPQGRQVAGQYATELAHATKLPIADLTGGHHASR